MLEKSWVLLASRASQSVSFATTILHSDSAEAAPEFKGASFQTGRKDGFQALDSHPTEIVLMERWQPKCLTKIPKKMQLTQHLKTMKQHSL